MIDSGERHDPVGKRYLAAEKFDRRISYVTWAAILCFAAYALLHEHSVALAKVLKFAFIVLSIAAVALGAWHRYTIQPVADRERRRLLISDGLGANLTAMRQAGYYNNDAQPSTTRLLLNLAENTFFAPRLIRFELSARIASAGLLFIALLISLRFGSMEAVELIAVLLLFSDAVLGRVVRDAWANVRLRYLHGEVKAALLSERSSGTEETAVCIALVAEYEYIKARTGSRALERTFRRLNEQISRDWESYRDAQLRRPGH